MSKFEDKLRRLHASRVRAQEASTEDAESRRVYHADEVEEQSADDASTDAAPREASAAWERHGARIVDDAVAVLTHPHDVASRHGRFRLGDGLKIAFPDVLREILGFFAADVGIRDVAFIDIETCGLRKKDPIFCVGVGRWAEASFVVTQWVMTDPDAERHLLEAIASEMASAEALVTFNGSTFDLNRLRARFSVHGVEDALDSPEHLDLLRIARRLFPADASRGLQALERDVLGFRRRGDLPGSEAPARWSEYLVSRDPARLLDVLEHNRLDVLSLLVFLTYVDGLMDGESTGQTTYPSGSPSERKTHQSAAHREPGASREFRQKLVRTYRLKQKGRRIRRSGADDDRSQRRPATPSSPPRATSRSSRNVGPRLEELRREATRLIDAGEKAAAVPLLHEMAALSPHNPFPLAKLVDYYRETGDEALAALFEERLQGVAPY